MKKYILVTVGLCLVVGFMYLYMTNQIAWGTWRYRITIEIETPEGIRTGSAVREIHAIARPALPGEPGRRTSSKTVRGEAVVIDLGERGVVFFLVGGYAHFYNAFPIEGPATAKGVHHFNAIKPGMKGMLPIKDRHFISFKDLDNPRSIYTVTSDSFEKEFGHGVKLKKITIEMTDDPVTWGGVVKHLKWIEKKRMGLKKWDPEYPDSAHYILGNSFIRKGKK